VWHGDGLILITDHEVREEVGPCIRARAQAMYVKLWRERGTSAQVARSIEWHNGI